jgi:serine/threonine protein kinase
MKHLSDKALARLRVGPDLPDLCGARYRLIGQVARGGMGVVYAANDDLLERRVALKVLDVASSGGELASRLMREARVLARLEHPGIVPVHDVGTLADGRVFYIMKFVEGRRLDQYVESLPSTPDRLRTLLRIFLQTCDAVSFAHTRGVLHRDLKPANVMVGSFGEVLVMDWGLAKILDGAETGGPQTPILHAPEHPENESAIPAITNHGRVMGTPGYMSPEQARGEIEILDARSDIFSLGRLLRYLLSAEISASQLDRSLEAIGGKACAQDREQRYSTVQDLAADVSRYLDGLAVAAHRESIFEKLTRFYRRYRFFILLIAAYLLMRVVLLLVIKH